MGSYGKDGTMILEGIKRVIKRAGSSPARKGGIIFLTAALAKKSKLVGTIAVAALIGYVISKAWSRR